MRFSTPPHRCYGGGDLHARTLSRCLLDTADALALRPTRAAAPDAFLRAVLPFRDGRAGAWECLFAGYGLADLGTAPHLPVVRGHARSRKASPGGQAQTDPIDAPKIAVLRRGGMPPQAAVYPKGLRQTRDLRRRRTFLGHRRAEALLPLTNTTSQDNRPPFPPSSPTPPTAPRSTSPPAARTPPSRRTAPSIWPGSPPPPPRSPTWSGTDAHRPGR